MAEMANAAEIIERLARENERRRIEGEALRLVLRSWNACLPRRQASSKKAFSVVEAR